MSGQAALFKAKQKNRPAPRSALEQAYATVAPAGQRLCAGRLCFGGGLAGPNGQLNGSNGRWSWDTGASVTPNQGRPPLQQSSWHGICKSILQCSVAEKEDV